MCAVVKLVELRGYQSWSREWIEPAKSRVNVDTNLFAFLIRMWIFSDLNYERVYEDAVSVDFRRSRRVDSFY